MNAYGCRWVHTEAYGYLADAQEAQQAGKQASKQAAKQEGLGRPHREGHRRRRRGARGGRGRKNVINDKLSKYKQNTEMREIQKPKV